MSFYELSLIRGLVGLSVLLGGGFASAQMQYTTGYQPHFRPEAPGTLLYRSPTPELGGRLTNIIYHQGWLMAGFENPGSNSQTNDLRFRVMDISNLENEIVPVPYWPSDFGLDYGTNNRGREHWYSGNWGYNTHGHGRTATHVHWPVLNVQTFGGAVFRGIEPEEVKFNYGWYGPGGGGRLRRQLPWNADQDWAYSSTNAETIYLQKAWRDDPEGSWNPSNYSMKGIGQIPGGNQGVRGFPDMLGDKFFILSDQRNSGLTVYQVLDSQLADYDPATPIPELPLIGATSEEFGGYWPEFWASEDGRLYAVGVNNDIRVVDLTDLSDPKLIVVLGDNPSRNFRIRNAVYPKFQDNYMLIENIVIDMEQLIAGEQDPVVLELEAPPDPGGWRSGFDPSQFSFPLGNLIVTGGYGETTGGMFIHVRQQAPDTTPPTIRYHIPERDRTNYSRYMPINVIIHEELDSRTLNNGINFMVREVVGSEPSGDPLEMIFNLGSNNVMTLTPVDPFKADTTYQVDFPNENGVMDISGNRIVEYSWRFSTGNDVRPVDPVPTLHSFASADIKNEPGEVFSLVAEVEDSGPFEYRIDFGDGNGFGAPVSLAAGSHTLNFTPSYPEAGRYTIRFQIVDNFEVPLNASIELLVMEEPVGPSPTRSSPITVASDGRVWVVNPDADTVSIHNGETGAKINEIAVGSDPRGVAEDANGLMWVTCIDSDEIYRLTAAGTVSDVLTLPYGTSPFAVVPSPDAQTMYVTGYGVGNLYQFDISSPLSPTSIPLGPTARAIAVAADHSRVYVTRFISPQSHGEVWSVDPVSHAVRMIRVEYDPTQDGNNSGSGITNYINGIAISPQGDTAVVVGKKDNVFRGELFGNGGPNNENTVRTTLAVLDLATEMEVLEARRDFDNADSPTAVTYTPDGSMIFTTIQGNNQVQVIDAARLRDPVISTEIPVLKNTGNAEAVDPTGLAPQGLVFHPDTNRLFTQNFMSRTVAVFDVTEALEENKFNFDQLAEISSVANEPFSAEVLTGKQVFYNAADTRMGADSYISCATCHADGAHDGRNWDFTHRGEGLRNTTDLRGRSGTGHGNVHWSANFDEIHDFELDIVNHFQGTGFIDDGSSPNASLGAPNAGRNGDLDDMVAYVESLDESTLRRSPHRVSDGTHSAAALAGAEVFMRIDCTSCHRPDKGFTDSTLGMATLHDVGTLRDTSGGRLGSTLPGIDTPTLLGVWDSAPYLHDGSAETLPEVFQTAGGKVYQAEDGVISGADIITTVYAGNPLPVTSFGGFVLMDGAGESFSLSAVEGETGGTSEIEIRVTSDTGGTLRVQSAGTTVDVTIPAERVPNDWRRIRVKGLSLDAGTGNNVSFTHLSGGILAVDSVIVSTADQLAAAHAHRRAWEETTQQERQDLVAFLNELDQDWDGPELSPQAPAGLEAVAVDADKIRVVFIDQTALETGYVIEMRPEGGTWSSTTLPVVQGQGMPSFVEFDALSQGTMYEFRVAALAGDAQTDWAGPVSQSPLTPPGSEPIVIQALLTGFVDSVTGNGSADLGEAMRIGNDRYTGYILFDVPYPGIEILSATLDYRVTGWDDNDHGGTFILSSGSHATWTETALNLESALSQETAPGSLDQLASRTGDHPADQNISLALNGLTPGRQTLVAEQLGGESFRIVTGSWAPMTLTLIYGGVIPFTGPELVEEPTSTSVEYGEEVVLTVEAAGGSAKRYVWYRDGVALSDGPGIQGSATDTLTLTQAVSASDATYTVSVEDVTGTTQSSEFSVNVTGATALDRWNDDSFTEAERFDELVSGLAADPDDDGVKNVIEFLRGSNAKAEDAEAGPSTNGVGGVAYFDYRLRVDTGGVSCTVMYSSNLSSWNEVPSSGIQELSRENGIRNMRASVALNGADHLFFRLRVTR